MLTIKNCAAELSRFGSLPFAILNFCKLKPESTPTLGAGNSCFCHFVMAFSWPNWEVNLLQKVNTNCCQLLEQVLLITSRPENLS